MEWIKCADKQPELDKTVIFYWYIASPMDSEICIGYRTHKKSLDGVFWQTTTDTTDTISEFAVSHWMPLPADPVISKEESEILLNK